MEDLKIVVAPNFREIGEKVNMYINEIRGTNQNYLMDVEFVRFNNGEGKVVAKETFRDKDLYILSDVSNGDVTYKFRGKDHFMTPDEHFQDIKRVLDAECGHASKRTVIMPYLYQGRQDKRKDRESLDCAMGLQELEAMRVNEILTFDVHNAAVMGSVHRLPFESVFLSDILLLSMLENENIHDFNDLICISPDSGAKDKATFYANILGNVSTGMFEKGRDYSKVEDGNNKVIKHRYVGPENLEGRCAIITDDMIDTGGSILDTAKQLKDKGVSKAILMVTFALFSRGIDKFDEYFDKKIIDRVYTTNAAYIPSFIAEREWIKVVDCSYRLANLISELNYGNSISTLINAKYETAVKVKTLRKEIGKK